MHEQHRQQRPLLGATEDQRAVSFDHLKRPKDSKLDHRICPTPNATTAPLALKAPVSRGVYQALTGFDRFSTGRT